EVSDSRLEDHGPNECRVRILTWNETSGIHACRRDDQLIVGPDDPDIVGLRVAGRSPASQRIDRDILSANSELKPECRAPGRRREAADVLARGGRGRASVADDACVAAERPRRTSRIDDRSARGDGRGARFEARVREYDGILLADRIA